MLRLRTTRLVLLALCSSLLHGTPDVVAVKETPKVAIEQVTPVIPVKKYIDHTRVAKAQQEFGTMARNTKIRCWIGFVAKVAMNTAGAYASVVPLLSGQGELHSEVYQVTGIGALTRRLLLIVGIEAVKSLVSSVVNEKAEPLLAKFREKSYVPSYRCWFLRSPGMGPCDVALSQDMAVFIELLQLLDAAVFNVARNADEEDEHMQVRREEAVQAVVRIIERILGHIHYSQQAMADDQMFGCPIAEGVSQRLEAMTEHFCTTIANSAAVDSAEVQDETINKLSETFMQKYQKELLLLRSVPAYALEYW